MVVSHLMTVTADPVAAVGDGAQIPAVVDGDPAVILAVVAQTTGARV